MNKKGIIFSVFSIIAATYVALSLLLTNDKNTVFWMGFGFLLFSVIVMAIITAISTHKISSAFPVEISIITWSGIYVALTLAINLLFGYIFSVPTSSFISIHIICLVVVALTTLLLFIIKASVIKQNNAVNGKICEMQVLLYEYEKIKSKIIDMPAVPRKKALVLIDGLLDELRFSDFGISADVSDMDNKLRSQAEVLSSEVENLISINSEDLGSMESIINDINKTIKDRNMQIKLMSSSNI